MFPLYRMVCGVAAVLQRQVSAWRWLLSKVPSASLFSLPARGCVFMATTGEEMWLAAMASLLFLSVSPCGVVSTVLMTQSNRFRLSMVVLSVPSR